jgi:hypothetical protein
MKPGFKNKSGCFLVIHVFEKLRAGDKRREETADN